MFAGQPVVIRIQDSDMIYFYITSDFNHDPYDHKRVCVRNDGNNYGESIQLRKCKGKR